MKNTAEIKLDLLIPNTWNPNQMTDDEFAELVSEVKHLDGPAKPLILRKKGDGYEIVDGEQTYKALLENGYMALKEGWYEIQDLDDFEAMRQTYKRNQHGSHDPVKLGQLFKRLMAEKGLSGRDLADEIGVSEGTIRNALMYAEMAEKRPDMDFKARQLTIRQIRYYLKLPPILNDIWLNSGADIRLVWGLKSADKFEELERYRDTENPPDIKDWEKTGLISYLKPTSRDFWHCIKKLNDWDNFERKWCKGGIKREQLRPYVEHYYQGDWVLREEYLMSGALNLLVDTRKFPASFRLTPEEFEKVVHADVSEDRNSDFENRLKLSILEKCGADSLKDTDWHVRDRLVEKELEEAPDYIRASRLNEEEKLMLYKNFKDVPDEAKRAVAGYVRIPTDKHQNLYVATELLLKQECEKIELKNQWLSRSEADIAATLAKRVCNYIGTPESADVLRDKLQGLAKDQLLALDHYSRGMERYEADMRALMSLLRRA